MFKVRSRKPKPTDTLNAQICEAIAKQCLLRCVYDDSERTLEPYCHGHSHDSVELLSAYQLEGPSGAGWKTLTATKIAQVEILEERFFPRADYNAASPGITRVHCKC